MHMRCANVYEVRSGAHEVCSGAHDAIFCVCICTYSHIFIYARILVRISVRYIKRILQVKCTYSKRIRTNVRIGIYRFIAYILSDTTLPQPWARPRLPLAPLLRSASPPGERVGECVDCQRSFANVDVPPSNQLVACK